MTRASKQERGNDTREQRRPDRKDTRQATGRRKSPRHPTPKTRQATSNPHEGNRPATLTPRHRKQQATATEANQDRDANRPRTPRPTCRTNGELNDTMIGRNETGTDSKQTRRMPQRNDRTRGTESKQGREKRQPHEEDGPRMTGKHETGHKPRATSRRRRQR